jgi:hypothetical protein
MVDNFIDCWLHFNGFSEVESSASRPFQINSRGTPRQNSQYQRYPTGVAARFFIGASLMCLGRFLTPAGSGMYNAKAKQTVAIISERWCAPYSNTHNRSHLNHLTFGLSFLLLSLQAGCLTFSQLG